MPKNFPVSIKFKALDKISKVVNKITSKFPKMSRAVNRTGRAFQALQKRTAKFKRSLSRIGSSMSNFGKNMTLGLTVPIGLFGAASIRASAKFETAMNTLAVKIGKPLKEIKFLEDRAKDLGITTQFSATQAADAMIDLAKKGFNPKEIDGMIVSVTNLAAAHKIDLAQAADIAGVVLKTTGKNISESVTQMDQLTKATNKSALGIEDFQENFLKAGAVAAKNNVPFSELLVIMGKLADEGQKSGAGRAVKNFVATLAAPKKLSKDQLETLNKLNIRMKDLFDPKTKKFKGLVNAFTLLGKAGADTSDLMTLFGRNFIGQAQILASIGKESFADLGNEIKDSAGETAKNAAAIMKGATGAMKGFMSAVEGLGIAVGASGLLEWFTDITQFASGLLRGIAGLNPTFLKWATIIGIVIAVIGPLLILIGGFLTMLPFIITGFTTLTALMAGFSIASLPITGTFLAIAAGIAAVVAIIAVLIIKWDFFKAVFVNGWNAMKTLASSAIDTIISKAALIGIAIKKSFASAVGFVQNKIAFISSIPGFKTMLKIAAAVLPGGGAIAAGVTALGAAGLQSQAGENTTNTNNASVNVNFSNTPDGTDITQKPGGGVLLITQGLSQ